MAALITVQLLCALGRQGALGRAAHSAGPGPSIQLSAVSPAAARSALRQPVYIEDTDAYSVLYHNNYAKFVHRALQAHCARGSTSAACAVELLGLDDLRFIRPATLGDDVLVETSVVEEMAGGELVAHHSLACATSGESFARVRSYSRPRQGGRDGAALPLEQLPGWIALETCAPLSAPHAKYELTVWEDELSSHGGLSGMAVLRAFERARTDALGGPAVLSRLQDERAKCLVARIDELAFNVQPGGGLPSVRLGQVGLRVCSTAGVRKARIVFEQRLVCSAGALLARGLVTCLCVDAESGKMSAPPAWLVSTIEGALRER